MSGYFDALMRSGGIILGRNAPDRTQAAALAPGPLEVAAEYSAPELARAIGERAPTQDEATVPVSSAHALEPPSQSASVVTEGSGQVPPAAPVPQSMIWSAPRSDSSPLVDATTAAPSPAPTETERAVPGETPVRAAMRWVAAGPQQARAGSALALARESALPMPRFGGASVGIDGAPPEQPQDAEREAPAMALPRQHAAVTERRPSREPDLDVRSPAPIARMRESLPSLSPMPTDHGEVLEVSIGAIHVRVDAQGAQTVARPPMTAPNAAARATSVPAPSRSALSRRALRRI